MPTIVVDVMPSAVRMGKRFELTVDGEVTEDVLATARRIADEILSNSVIEDVVEISVVESTRAESTRAEGTVVEGTVGE